MDRNKLNAAQQLRQALGVEVIEAGQFPRNASATKRGPGRPRKETAAPVPAKRLVRRRRPSPARSGVIS